VIGRGGEQVEFVQDLVDKSFLVGIFVGILVDQAVGFSGFRRGSKGF